ncbi:hypothetical protein [uncultured Thalassolituus sp.]|uniref:hypothetical protein n=1 Tax=uncultured Thalassolituus sp. TaxID=285273 RepID=UPI002622A21A|nr:hypothetical protein [uncultured Thalassolituus sp.]
MKYLSLTLLLFSSFVNALTVEQMQKVSDTAISACRGGTLSGGESLITASGKAQVQSKLMKYLVDMGAEGDIKFTSKDWEGIQAVIPTDFNQEVHSSCVSTMITFFTSKLEPSNYEKNKEEKHRKCIAALRCNANQVESTLSCLNVVEDMYQDDELTKQQCNKALVLCYKSLKKVNQCYTGISADNSFGSIKEYCEELTKSRLKDHGDKEFEKEQENKTKERCN